jgi:nicotinamidase-related amidase
VRREIMAKLAYDKDVTALLVIDLYNDFISEGGKEYGTAWYDAISFE